MDDRSQSVADALAACLARLDAVYVPWGFTFEHDGVKTAHRGYYASGHYRRGTTRIGLSCRDTIDNLYYKHSFVTENRWNRETELFFMNHNGLMRVLGHSDDCHLVCPVNWFGNVDPIVARDGGDRVTALIHDMTSIAASVLREPCEQFDNIMRQWGGRSFRVENI